LSEGVKSQADKGGWIATLLNPLVIGGIALLVGWMLFRMALLSITPMSVVLPITAGLAYLLTSAVGQVLLRETVGKQHGVALAFIFIGVLLIGSSTSKDAGNVE